MLTSKRIDGDYSIVSTSGGTITLTANLVSIPGDLTVNGTTTTISADDLFVKDKIITLNDGETGPGVQGGGLSGITVDRGDGVTAGEIFAQILWDEANNVWVTDIGDGNGPINQITTGAIGGAAPMFNLIDDVTPQVGGTGGLDMRTNNITTSDLGSDVAIAMPIGNSNDITITVLNASSNIILTASGLNGEIIATSPVLLQGGAPNTTPAAGEAALFKGAETGGGTQVHYQNDTTTGEMISKDKAIMYSLIF